MRGQKSDKDVRCMSSRRADDDKDAEAEEAENNEKADAVQAEDYNEVSNQPNRPRTLAAVELGRNNGILMYVASLRVTTPPACMRMSTQGAMGRPCGPSAEPNALLATAELQKL